MQLEDMKCAGLNPAACNICLISKVETIFHSGAQACRKTEWQRADEVTMSHLSTSHFAQDRLLQDSTDLASCFNYDRLMGAGQGTCMPRRRCPRRP